MVQIWFEVCTYMVEQFEVVIFVLDPFIFAFFVINETIFTRAYDLPFL